MKKKSAFCRRLGYAPWLATQVVAPVSQGGFDWLASRGYSSLDTTTAYYDNTYPGDYMVWHQLIASPGGMRQRVALALSEFFELSLSSLRFNWRSQAAAAWWDLLAANAFGNHRTLLEGVTLNLAMGSFLGVKGNMKENVATGRQPDENFGREVMQLFTIGLYQLNPTTALAGGRQFALHPAMTGLSGLFNAGQAAVQLNVGPLVVPLTKA